ncbi:cytochrome p450 [Colletotrichum plurivorum]|uniref:Cytochrome p450 n=1 Tax=Colletotrichum plurivorum TaxID=2175906 RepID=A0A8H6JUZ1_9PEZI|nr:cytochrome p450 [Colletotrichum plurivorum]
MITTCFIPKIGTTLCSYFFWAAGGVLLLCVYHVHLRHLLSSFRTLPSPSQGPFWKRLLYEPRLPEIEQWVDTIPNKGVIRPKAAKEFLAAGAYKFVKPELQATLSELISGRGLLTIEGEEHKQVRRKLNPAFSQANLRAGHHGLPAADNGPEAAFAGAALIQLPIAAASIDMVGHFGYSVEFGTLNTMASSKHGVAARHAHDKRKRFGRAFVHMFKTTRHGQLTLQAASIIGPKIALKLPLRAVRTIKSIMGLFYEMMREVVEDHVKAEAGEVKADAKVSQERVDIMTHAVRSGVLSHADLVEEGVHMISGGTEMSIGTATWAMHLLSRHLIRKEIRANVPSPYDRGATPAIEQADLRRLPYLNAVANEVLRFHFVNGLLWRDCVEPATIAGVHIPKGSTVIFSPWALNRDPKHWGPTARVFDPDRWLKNPTTGGADHPNSFMTFGGGPRRCIGEQYARNQLLCIIAAYIGRFELAPLDAGGSDEGTEIGDNFALTLFKVLDGWELRVRKIPGW